VWGREGRDGRKERELKVMIVMRGISNWETHDARKRRKTVKQEQIKNNKSKLGNKESKQKQRNRTKKQTDNQTSKQNACISCL
jgi:ERCC4-related helicase